MIIYESENFRIGVSNFFGQRRARYNPEGFSNVPLLAQQQLSTSCLKPKELQILQLLEARSYDNYGDTKIYSDRLSKATNIPIRTLYRIFSKLESLGYMTRSTEVKMNNESGYRSIRTFRMWRVVLRFGCKPKIFTGWKNDNRPKTDRLILWRSLDNKRWFKPKNAKLPTQIIPEYDPVTDTTSKRIGPAPIEVNFDADDAFRTCSIPEADIIYSELSAARDYSCECLIGEVKYKALDVMGYNAKQRWIAAKLKERKQEKNKDMVS